MSNTPPKQLQNPLTVMQEATYPYQQVHALAALAEEQRTANLIAFYTSLPATPSYLPLRDRIYQLLLERLELS